MRLLSPSESNNKESDLLPPVSPSVDIMIKKEIITNLEKGNMPAVHAIILHRTGGSSLSAAIASFRKSGIGTHFIIDKDGTIRQTANTNKYAYHIGKIRARCMEEGTCSPEEAKKIKGFGWAPTKIHNNEKVKKYPARYPLNTDSLGIEVVSKYNTATKIWDPATPQQKTAINYLVKKLQATFNLTDKDIYEHDKISYKTAGEGAGLYAAG